MLARHQGGLSTGCKSSCRRKLQASGTKACTTGLTEQLGKKRMITMLKEQVVALEGHPITIKEVKKMMKEGKEEGSVESAKGSV